MPFFNQYFYVGDGLGGFLLWFIGRSALLSLAGDFGALKNSKETKSRAQPRKLQKNSKTQDREFLPLTLVENLVDKSLQIKFDLSGESAATKYIKINWRA